MVTKFLLPAEQAVTVTSSMVLLHARVKYKFNFSRAARLISDAQMAWQKEHPGTSWIRQR